MGGGGGGLRDGVEIVPGRVLIKNGLYMNQIKLTLLVR